MRFSKDICNAFNTKAEAAIHATGEVLLERLNLLKIAPKRILDIYQGEPVFTEQLKAKYPSATIDSIHINESLQALKDDTYDLVFSNQAFQWCEAYEETLDNIKRIMRINAPFMFATFGPDTETELPITFKDMHDVGDILLKTKFLDPVMDMDAFDVHFRSTDETLSYEAIYGHAWKQEVNDMAVENETSIALSALRRMLNKE